MKFKADEAKEFSPLSLLAPGSYNFVVLSAEEKVSKSGNEMIALLIKVTGKDKEENLVRDWLLPAYPRKICAFCEAVGLDFLNEDGNITEDDCMSATGRLKLDIETGTPKGDGTLWADKNCVKSYIKASAKAPPEDADIVDCDIPF